MTLKPMTILVPFSLLLLTPFSSSWAEDSPGKEPPYREEPKAPPAKEDVVVLKARKLRKQGDAHRDAHQYEDAISHYKEATNLLRGSQANDAELATVLNDLMFCFSSLGKFHQALPYGVEALAKTKHVHKGDHQKVAIALHNLSNALISLSKYKEAYRYLEELHEMYKRLHEGDHVNMAECSHMLAQVLVALGKHQEARPYAKAAVDIYRRLKSDDHPNLAWSLRDSGVISHILGRHLESRDYHEKALAMFKRLHEGDHQHVAMSMHSLASVLNTIGELQEAFSYFRDALEMRRRLYKGDHLVVAESLCGVAHAFHSLGRADKARLHYEMALEMYRRLIDGDNSAVAKSLSGLAYALVSLGKTHEAYLLFKESLRIRRRLHGGDHPDVAWSMSGLAYVLQSLGKLNESYANLKLAHEMRIRLFGKDHPDVAWSLNGLGFLTLYAHDDPQRAYPYFKKSLEMRKRLYEGDHPTVARSLNNMAYVLSSLGRLQEAYTYHVESLDMYKRLFANDHPDVVDGLYNLAVALAKLKRMKEARSVAREALDVGARINLPSCYMIRVFLGALLLQEKNVSGAVKVLQLAASDLESRRRESASLGSEDRTQFVAKLRESDPFPLLLRAYVMQGDAEQAFSILERSRGREMLDLLRRGEIDPLHAAKALASERRDRSLHARIQEVQLSVDRASSALSIAKNVNIRVQRLGKRMSERNREAEQAAQKAYEDALRERLFVIREALPEGRPLTSDQARALLNNGERILAYSLGERSHVIALSKDGVKAYELGTKVQPISAQAISKAVSEYRAALATKGATSTTAGDHPGTILFNMLIPKAVWNEVKGTTRLYVLPHGSLHQLPFEALVVRSEKDKPIYWIKEGPPIAYAVSAAVLGALKKRPRAIGRSSIVAVADPAFDGEIQWPEKGVVITNITPNSQAAKAKLRKGDVIASYNGKETSSMAELVSALRAVDPKATEAALVFEREGKKHTATLEPGRLGVHLANEPPPIAGPKLLARASVGVIRGDDRGRLAPLPGTRIEVKAIASLIEQTKRDTNLKALIGKGATEAALFDAASSPRILHLATHGIIEPDKGARASRLALTPPRVPIAGNDGSLSLGDLLERWRSRLKGTELVVLSACNSHSGKLDANEGMLALPWGFCFAGARSCISSLWQVDDESTAKLMTELYRRLLDGDELRPCEALHAARLELMKTHPDPYHWAPFLFAGAP